MGLHPLWPRCGLKEYKMNRLYGNELLSECLLRFYYSVGKLYHNRGGKRGKEAGTIRNKYRDVTIYGKGYGTQRIIFLMHHKYLPECVDHINRDKLDNRIENLRACTISQNGFNQSSTKGSSSKYLGVSWDRTAKRKWLASAQLNKKKVRLGNFDSEDDAAKAYNEFAKENYGDFANLNIIGDGLEN